MGQRGRGSGVGFMCVLRWGEERRVKRWWTAQSRECRVGGGGGESSGTLDCSAEKGGRERGGGGEEGRAKAAEAVRWLMNTGPSGRRAQPAVAASVRQTPPPLTLTRERQHLEQHLTRARAPPAAPPQDFKATQADLLGQTRKLGGGDRPNLPANHTYGLHSLRHGPEPGVDQLIQGAYTAAQQAPDADLGKSLREGWRNVAPEGRTFGVPSIRTDVPKPRVAGVANTRNYGNEPDALQLLRPPKSVELGVGEEAYMAMRSRDEVRALVADAALQLSDEEFERCWGMAAGADGEGPDRACLDTFFRARHHVLSQTLEVAVPF
eukprot:358731-Chlamydomonas_euryale.AAC.10